MDHPLILTPEQLDAHHTPRPAGGVADRTVAQYHHDCPHLTRGAGDLAVILRDAAVPSQAGTWVAPIWIFAVVGLVRNEEARAEATMLLGGLR